MAFSFTIDEKRFALKKQGIMLIRNNTKKLKVCNNKHPVIIIN